MRVETLRQSIYLCEMFIKEKALVVQRGLFVSLYTLNGIVTLLEFELELDFRSNEGNETIKIKSTSLPESTKSSSFLNL